MELLSNPAVLALIGTIFGGAGLKFVEHLLNKNKVTTDLAANIRNELRTDVASLRAEITRIDKELDEWKAKYYELLAAFYRQGIDPEDDPEFPKVRGGGKRTRAKE